MIIQQHEGPVTVSVSWRCVDRRIYGVYDLLLSEPSLISARKKAYMVDQFDPMMDPRRLTDSDVKKPNCPATKATPIPWMAIDLGNLYQVVRAGIMTSDGASKWCCLLSLSHGWIITFTNKQWDLMPHHWPNFNGGLAKPPLKLRHGWINVYETQKSWIYLFSHVYMKDKVFEKFGINPLNIVIESLPIWYQH